MNIFDNKYFIKFTLKHLNYEILVNIKYYKDLMFNYRRILKIILLFSQRSLKRGENLQLPRLTDEIDLYGNIDSYICIFWSIF